MNYHQNLSKKIKQINSIEHKKISGMSIFAHRVTSKLNSRYSNYFRTVEIVMRYIWCLCVSPVIIVLTIP